MSKSDKAFVEEVVEHLILEKSGALPDHGHVKDIQGIKKVKNKKHSHEPHSETKKIEAKKSKIKKSPFKEKLDIKEVKKSKSDFGFHLFWLTIIFIEFLLIWSALIQK